MYVYQGALTKVLRTLFRNLCMKYINTFSADVELSSLTGGSSAHQQVCSTIICRIRWHSLVYGGCSSRIALYPMNDSSTQYPLHLSTNNHKHIHWFSPLPGSFLAILSMHVTRPALKTEHGCGCENGALSHFRWEGHRPLLLYSRLHTSRHAEFSIHFNQYRTHDTQITLTRDSSTTPRDGKIHFI
jgi:hypothetical protein